MSRRAWLGCGAGAALCLGVLVGMSASSCQHAPSLPGAAQPPASQGASGEIAEAAAPLPVDAARPPPVPAEPLRPVPLLPAAALASPEATVKTALDLLDHARIEAFRETFLPSLRAEITPSLFEACQRRVRQTSVAPDWEMAERTVLAGHAVTRVSMFGKSMTGFYDVGGRWLADAIWCRPTVP